MQVGEMQQTDTARQHLSELMKSGELAIIPVGFRCFTKIELEKQLGVDQETLVFDNGFFPPVAVARLLAGKTVDLDAGHTACIKFENHVDGNNGLGIRFVSSTYSEIDQLATSPDLPEINRFLDSTFGYYTLDVANRYVLAHYNWHSFGAVGDRVHNVAENVAATSEILTRRLERIMQRCYNARSILFVLGETQGYQYMQIDDEVHDLHNFAPIAQTTHDLFGEKCKLVTLAEIASAEDAIALL